nr:pentatricopeptide repeat-containing protein [Quercus suber]
MLHASLPKPTCINQTLIAVLNQCKSMHELKQVYALITTLGLSQDDPFVSKILSFSALSDWGFRTPFEAGTRDIRYARTVFDGMLTRNLVSWNAMLDGLNEAFPTFDLWFLILLRTKRWDDARTMRDAMLRRGVKKSPGFSFVEIFGNLHRDLISDLLSKMLCRYAACKFRLDRGSGEG